MEDIKNEFTINRENFVKSMSSCIKVCNERSIIPIWGFLKIDVEGGALNIYGRSEEMQIGSFMKALNTSGDFSMCVQGQIFYETIRLLDAEDVRVIDNGKDITVVVPGKKKRYKMPRANARDFHLMQIPEDIESFDIHSNYLSSSMSNISKVVNVNDLRSQLQGISLSKSNDTTVEIFGASSYVMGKVQIKSTADIVPVIIPKKTFDVISAIGASGPVTIKTNKKMCVFDLGGVIVTSNLIDAKIIDTSGVYKSKDEDSYIVINREELIKAIQRLNLYSAGAYSIVKLNVSGDVVELKSKSDEKGLYADEEIDVKNPNNIDTDIAVNASFLLHVAQSLDGDYIRLYIKGPKVPCFAHNDISPDDGDVFEIWALMGIYFE